jgi:hypothetical protein
MNEGNKTKILLSMSGMTIIKRSGLWETIIRDLHSYKAKQK